MNNSVLISYVNYERERNRWRKKQISREKECKDYKGGEREKGEAIVAETERVE